MDIQIGTPYKEPTCWAVDVRLDGGFQQLVFRQAQAPSESQIAVIVDRLIENRQAKEVVEEIAINKWLNGTHIDLVKQGENMAWNNRTETTTVVTFLKKVVIDRKNAEVTMTYAKAFPTGQLNELGQPTYEDFVEQSFTMKITDLVANYGISAESLMNIDNVMDDMAQTVYSQLTNVSV